MRILYITLEDLSLHKGSVIHIQEVVSGLRKLGHQVKVMARCSGKSKHAEMACHPQGRLKPLAGFPRFRILSLLVSSIHLFFLLFRTLPCQEIVYARDYHTALIAFLPKWVLRQKLILEVNGLAHEEVRLKGSSTGYRFLSFLIRRAEEMAVRCCDHVISVTPQIASILVTETLQSATKTTIVGNGVDVKRFYPIADRDALSRWRRRFEIGEYDPVIGFVGNLAPWQGVDILIESAFSILLRQRKVKFLIVGDGILKQKLLKRVSHSGNEQNFIFAGMVNHPDVPALINLMDICVAPFIAERNRKTGVSPLKVYEYLSCGKPVIASRIEGVEFVEEMKAGILVKPGDSIELGETLLEVLNAREEWKEMGRRGRKIALEQFTWESKVKVIDRVLHDLA